MISQLTIQSQLYIDNNGTAVIIKYGNNPKFRRYLMKKNKKRKGFTLIELIAVIAILGILALIIVPRVSGYTKTAKDNATIANCKIIVNAVEVYNADVDSGDNDEPAIDSATTIDTVKTDLTSGTCKSKKVYLNSWPTKNVPTGTYNDILTVLGITTK